MSALPHHTMPPITAHRLQGAHCEACGVSTCLASVCPLSSSLLLVCLTLGAGVYQDILVLQSGELCVLLQGASARGYNVVNIQNVQSVFQTDPDLFSNFRFE